MSYCYTGLAVRAEQAPVLEALALFARVRGGTLHSDVAHPDVRGAYGYFKLGTHEGWTLVGFTSVCIAPTLFVHLSRHLQTRVIAIGEYEVIGLEHYSEIDRGRTERMFSYLEGEPEMINVDPAALVELAKAEGKTIKFPRRMLEDDDITYTHDILISLICEFNLEELLMEGLYDDGVDRYFHLDISGIEALTIGGRTDCAGWSQLLAEDSTPRMASE